MCHVDFNASHTYTLLSYSFLYLIYIFFYEISHPIKSKKKKILFYVHTVCDIFGYCKVAH